MYHTANVYQHQMFVTGGFQKKKQLQDFFVFNFNDLTWTKLPDCPFTARSGHLGVENGNLFFFNPVLIFLSFNKLAGLLFIHGGELGTQGNGYKSSSDIWVYDISNLFLFLQIRFNFFEKSHFDNFYLFLLKNKR